jgi:hypothetical protein
VAHTNLMAIANATPTTTPVNKPLACVFVTNLGNSSVTVVVLFNVTTFGAAVITINVTFVGGQVASISFGFTLAADNDGGPQDCSPSGH